MVEVWQKKLTLGDWVMNHIEIGETDDQKEEFLDLMYFLDTENNRLRAMYTDEKTGSSRRLTWDVR